jgi:hypothetical protein
MHHKQNIVKLNISRDEALNERIARSFVRATFVSRASSCEKSVTSVLKVENRYLLYRYVFRATKGAQRKLMG